MEYNRRVTDDFHAASNAVGLYVKAAVAMCSLTVVGVLVASILVPDNPSIILTIVSVTGPIIAALIALAQKSTATGVNGRMEQVIAVTGEKKRLEAVVDTLAATTNPEVAHLTTDSKDKQAAANAANGTDKPTS